MSLANGTITFTPSVNFSGQARFEYVLANGVATDIGTVTVNVTPVTDTVTLVVTGSTDPVPLTGDVTVNTTTGGQQQYSSIATIAGGYVVTWSSKVLNQHNWNIYAQRFADDGTPIGGETQVSTSTADAQQYPAEHLYSSASAVDGGYLITWTSRNQDGSDHGIYARRYSSDGIPQGDEFRSTRP